MGRGDGEGSVGMRGGNGREGGDSAAECESLLREAMRRIFTM